LILSENKIKDYIEKGLISIEPFDIEYQLNGLFIDLTLSERFYRYSQEILYPLEMLDLKNPYSNILEKDFISDNGVVIEKNNVLIVETKEYVKVDESIAISIENKFRFSKMGLQILNTGIVGNGYEGNIVVVLYNTNDFPVRIFKDMKICHISFAEVK